MRKVRKAIFPVAGLGTRFLPAAKAVPKEMLTIVDRPVIQHVVEEARAAGIEHFIFVTGRNKEAIENHFDRAFELECTLKRRDNAKAMALLNASGLAAGCASFTRQREPLGLGHAVWCARDLVGCEPFAVLLPDMLMKASPGCLAQLMELHVRYPEGNIIAIEEVPRQETCKYGVVAGRRESERHIMIEDMVEKPPPGTAPSNLIISGRYVFQPEIFDVLEMQEPGAGGEIQLTDAMRTLMRRQAFHGLVYDGETFDCGGKRGFIAANMALALEDADLQDEMPELVSRIVSELGGVIAWGSEAPWPSWSGSYSPPDGHDSPVAQP